MRVEQVMTSEIATCAPEDSLARAAAIMWEHDCGCVPVVENGDKVVGMLTDRDVCMAAWSRGQPLADLRVANAMSKEPFTCHRETSLVEAERIMQAHEVRRLPVVDGEGRLVGLLSLADLAREAVREHGRKIKGVHAEEIDMTLAAVSRPRLVDGVQPRRHP